MADVATLLMTDDEVAAISSILGRRWQVPLRSVDATDPQDLRRSVGRGLRSLGLRDLRTEAPLDPEVAPLDSIMGLQPNLFISIVDAEARVDPNSPWLLGWLLGDSAVGVTVLPDGTYLLEQSTSDELLELVSAEFLAATADDVALLVTAESATVSPGLIRSGNTLRRVGPGVENPAIEPIELADAAAVVAEVRRLLWSTR